MFYSLNIQTNLLFIFIKKLNRFFIKLEYLFLFIQRLKTNINRAIKKS